MEFPELGTRCSQPDCQQLDFLPVKCTHCEYVYCKDHLSPWIHQCKKFDEKILTDQDILEREKIKWQIPCSLKDCKQKELVPVICPKCSKFFCLLHRHPDQHKCLEDPVEQEALKKKVSADKERKRANDEVQAKVRESVTKNLEKAQEEGGSKGAMAKKLAYMKLKMRSKGDPAVPVPERVFFTVDCPSEQNPRLDLYYSKIWTLGKIIDFTSRQARIKNRNHIAGEKKLHMFKGDICLSNPFDKTLAQILEDKELKLEDGDSIILKYLEA